LKITDPVAPMGGPPAKAKMIPATLRITIKLTASVFSGFRFGMNRVAPLGNGVLRSVHKERFCGCCGF